MSKIAQFPEKEMRLVLIGKTGAGKSAAANTILGRESCEVARGLSSGTEQCDMHKDERHGFVIKVTDTPGVCDTHRPLEEIHKEICKSLATVAPGPHAVVMCLRCDRRFTDEEYQAYDQLMKLFGDGLKNYMILVFNGVDQAGGKPDFEKLSQKIKNLGLVLDDLGSARNERLLVFNNEASWENRKEQGDQLLDAVTGVFLANNRNYFTDDIIDRFEEEMAAQVAQGKTREAVQTAVLSNDETVSKDFEKALPKEEVKKKGRGCIIV